MNNLKEYIIKCFHKPFLFCVLAILCAVLTVVIIANSVLHIREMARSNWAVSVDMIDQRMNSLLYEINNFPRYAGNDMVFLSKLSSVLDKDTEKLEQDFISFILENTAYYQLVYLDESANTQVLTEFDGENYRSATSVNNFVLASNVFEKTKLLNKGEIYISPVELYKRPDGTLENRGTSQDPRYVPVITYATPVFSDQGKRIGLIAALVYADYFLDDIRSFSREGETVFLIDYQGNYLAHPDRSREFANLLDRADSFQNDYPQVAGQIMSESERRIIESEDKIFSFRYIYPTKGSFAIFKGAEKINGKTKEDYHWIMVSVTNTNYLQNARSELTQQAIIYAALSLLIVGSIVGVGYRLAFGNRNRVPQKGDVR